MLGQLRVATWNLDHASRSDRPIELQIEKIRDKNPDILVLTETCKEVDLTAAGFECFPCQPNEYKKFDAAIFLGRGVRFKKRLPTYDKISAECVQVETAIGEVIVYATILPYHGYKGRTGTSSAWAEHYKAIREVGSDLERLQNPSNGKRPLIAAGDFNQTRDNSVRTYGTKVGRRLLSAELERNRLVCVTQENFGANGKLHVDPSNGRVRSNIDHICVTDHAFDVAEVGAWDHFTSSGKHLSDHNGVYVDLSPSTGRHLAAAF